MKDARFHGAVTKKTAHYRRLMLQLQAKCISYSLWNGGAHNCRAAHHTNRHIHQMH